MSQPTPGLFDVLGKSAPQAADPWPGSMRPAPSGTAARPPLAFAEAPHAAFAYDFAVSNNLLSVVPLQSILHPRVIYRSQWAGVERIGASRVSGWFRSIYGRARPGAMSAELVLLPNGDAGVWTRLNHHTLSPALTRFFESRGRALRIEVTPNFDPQSLQFTGWRPPEA